MGATKNLYMDVIQPIIEIAEENNNKISYSLVSDILKEENDKFSIEDIAEIIKDLEVQGISVESYEGEEGYENGTSNAFIPADVKITPRNVTIDVIIDRLQHEEINLFPKFQRKSGLWSIGQKSCFIESLMLKIPIPTFYFDAADDDKWIVIDGLQRLTALSEFMVDKTLKLCELEYLKELEGYGIDDLPRQYYRRIRETQIQIYTIEQGTPEEVVFNIFKRINTGGLNLEPQEIRHALYQGAATEMISELAQSEQFLRATQYAIKTDRMLDFEYINRYLAFTLLDYKKEYDGNIDNYLIKALKYVNSMKRDKILEEKEKFYQIMDCCHQIFQKYAFRKVNTDFRRGPINKAIYEMWVTCLYQLSQDDRKKLISKREEVLLSFQKFLQMPDIITAIKAGDKYSVTKRMNEIEKMVGGILGGK